MVKPIILAIIIAAALAWFGRNLSRLVKLVLQGQPENRFGDIDKRFRNVIRQVFLHERLLAYRKDAGLAHLMFFYGFLTIQVCAIEIFAEGFIPGFNYGKVLPQALYIGLMAAQDIMCMAVLLAIAYAAFRRTVLKPAHVMLTKDAWIILALIFGVVGTIYILGAADIKLGHRKGVEFAMPFESILAAIMGGLFSETVIAGIRESAWWAHILIVLGFLNYLPSSKHLHLLGAIPNIFFAKTERHAALPTPDLDKEDIEVFGCSEPKHFTWKHLLDTTACTECGRCTSVCPAAATGKPLSPMKIIHDLKLALFDTKAAVLGIAQAGGGAPPEPEPLIGGRISHDELWACTTCGGCVNICPVTIEHVDDIIDMRRNLVLMQSSFPEELQRTFTALENEGNPWGVSSSVRGEFAEKAGLKVLDEGEETGVLYWVGCAGIIDDKAKKVTQAMIKILDAAKVDYAVLGPAETCTGDPARRAGNEYLYQTLAKSNIETLNSRKFKKIVTQCPHCYNTLGNEYKDLGGDYKVLHHTELINGLLDEGKITMSKEREEKIAFHDPCYLGRWNGVVEEPRNILEALPGATMVEMERSKKQSFCCGAGGARMWLEEHIGTPVNLERSREAIATGADTIAVGCPFCKTMIADGVKDHKKEDDVRVMDVAELVAEALSDAPSAAAVGAGADSH